MASSDRREHNQTDGRVAPKYVWVSESYRNYIADRLGIQKPWEWQLLEYLLFYPHIDRRADEEDETDVDDDQHKTTDAELIIVPESYIRSITGIKRGVPGNSIKDLLKEFSSDTGIKLNVHPHRVYNPRARSVSAEYPDGVIDATTQELATLWRHKKDIVLFATGQRYTDRKHSELKRHHLDYILGASLSDDHPAKELVDILHSPRTNHLLDNQVLRTEEVASKAIQAIESEPRRRYAHRVYNMVRQCAYMRYRSTDKTCRIHSTDYCILQLPREIRRAVFTGLYSLDLRSSQLAIVADLWGIKSARAFLDNRGSIWAELLGFLGLDSSFKPGVKTILYSVIFGMGKKRLARDATEALGSPMILKHPIIRDILSQREKKLAQVVSNGGAYDAWGRFQPMSSCSSKAGATKYAKKILARVVQSYEMEIMLAGFSEIMNRKNDLALVAWLHDGIYVAATHNRSYTMSYLQQVNREVQKRAAELGIGTELEVELID